MPELPEVQTIVSDLNKLAKNHTILDLKITWPKMIQGTNSSVIKKAILNTKFIRFKRRGKYILGFLNNGYTLIFHLRMTGQLLYCDRSSPKQKYITLILTLNNGKELRFNDARKFGRIWISKTTQIEKVLPLTKLGIEPLSKDFTWEKLYELLQRPTKIKALLLDQTKVAGIGNIYADESLFLSQIHPRTPAYKLTKNQVKKLYQSIKDILKAAIGKRGTSERDYLDATGKVGQFKDYLKVYGRKGLLCKVCDTPIKYCRIAERGTHFCEKCQKKY